MNKRINSIDVLRLVASFFIVLIHSQVPFASVVNPISRFAVPVFFMISGYFYCTADSHKKKLQIKNIFILTIISSIGYFICHILKSFMDNGIAEYFKETFTIKSIVEFLFFNASPFNDHLWFLPALLYAMIIDYFFGKYLRKSNKVLIPLIIILLLVDVVFGKYSLLIFGRDFNYVYLRNFLFVGIPYLYSGYLFKNINTDKIKLNNISIMFFILLFEATTLLERFVLVHYNLSGKREQYISTTLVAILIFLLTIKNPAENPNTITKFLAKAGKKYSLAIYIVHPFIIEVVNTVVPHFGKQIFKIYRYISPVVIFVAVWIIAIIYYYVKDLIIKKFEKNK